MKTENLIDAIGLIDNELIEEAEKKRHKKSFYVKRLSVVAACFVIFLTGTFILYPILSENLPFFKVRKNGDDPKVHIDTSIQLEATDMEKPNDTLISENDPNASTNSKDNDSTNQSTQGGSVSSEGSGESLKDQPISDADIALIPMQISVTSFTEESIVGTVDQGIVGTVVDNGGNSSFPVREQINVVFHRDLELDQTINAGDIIYITYGISEEENTIIAYEIRTETTDTTPALFK
ncbi:MAG: hypothetical protein E7575_08125 [Ruminococcaceae bacterium]|nr:hypothetical protein [Oscillospiraceae bacterium]